MRLLLVVLIGLLALAKAEWKSYENYQQVEVVPRTHEQIRTLIEWMLTDPDSETIFLLEPSRLNAPVHILVPPRIRDVIYRRLNDLGLTIEVIDENVGAAVERERQRLATKPETRDFDFDDFNKYEDIMELLDDFEEDCPEELECEITVPGYTYEGRDMKILHIRNPNAVDPPVYWMDANIHSNEWVSAATLLKIIDHLVYEYDTDPDAKFMLDTHEWYFLPLANPDGYEYTWDEDRLWNKNRMPTFNDVCFGVDLNRNFDFKWCEEGGSHFPCNVYYCGPSGGSENETQVIQAESARIAASSNQRAWITLHEYGYRWLWPWGYSVDHEGKDCILADDHDEIERVAEITIEAIEDTHNTKWDIGNSCEEIYSTTGAVDDYVKGTDNWQHAIQPDLRGRTSVPDPDIIHPSYEEIWNGLVAMTAEV